MKWKGVITVYLTLIFLLVLSVIFTAVESARVQATRMLSETALDASLESLCAAYHRQLFEAYDVFFFDGALGGSRLDLERLTGKIRDDMCYELYPSRGLIASETDFCQMQTGNIVIDRMALATDDGGKVFRNQAIEAIRFDTGLEFVEAMTKNYDWAMDNLAKSESYTQKEKETNKSLALLEEEKSAVDEEKAEEAQAAQSQDNPAENIGAVRSMGILELMYKDPSKISKKSINLAAMPSHRSLNHGNGLSQYETGLTSNILFLAYLTQKFCHAATQNAEQKAGLQYRLEYLLMGKNSDIENLKAVVNRLLLVREGVNFTYLLTDVQKVSEAYTMATMLVGYTGLVPLIEATKYALLLAWAYAESVLDVKVLLAGKKVALVKTAANWKSTLSNIGEIASMDVERMGDADGVGYEQYLQMLMLIANQDELSMRAIDLVECDMRAATKNSFFKMDQCVYSLRAKVDMNTDSVFLELPFMKQYQGQGSKTMQMTRTYGYDVF